MLAPSGISMERHLFPVFLCCAAVVLIVAVGGMLAIRHGRAGDIEDQCHQRYGGHPVTQPRNRLGTKQPSIVGRLQQPPGRTLLGRGITHRHQLRGSEAKCCVL